MLARDHDEVDDGWLCDKGRFAYQALHVEERITAPMIRDGGELREVSWERALTEAANGLRRAGANVAALAGGGATNEEGLLLGRLIRDVLGSPHLDSRSGGEVSLAHWRALSAPALAAAVSDIEYADAVLVLDCEPVDDAPIVELRIRKGVRRNNVQLLVASDRPSALDSSATHTLRFAPGRGAELAWALAAALGGGGDLDQAAKAAGETASAVRAAAKALSGAGQDIVILYGERLLDGDAAGLLALADALSLADRDGAGLIGVPAAANGRGLREAGVLPNGGPGLSRPAVAGGAEAPAIAAKLAAGELAAVYLLGVDPLLSYPDAHLWGAALDRASTVIAHASFLTVGVRAHATVVFPQEASAEKEGTVTHPDGRVQRLRPAVGHPGAVRAEWRVLSEIAGLLGGDLAVATAASASAALFEAVGFYGGLTLERLAGRGVRWQQTDAAAALPAAARPAKPKLRRAPARKAGELALGSYRSIWAGPEVRFSPALAFLSPRQQLELSPHDAAALGVGHGQTVLVSDGEVELEARVALRDGAPPGTAFLAQMLAGDGANLLRGGNVTVRGAERVGQQAPTRSGDGELTPA